MSLAVQEINLEGVSPEQVQYLANLIEASKHNDADIVNKGEVPKLQQLVLNKCLSTISEDSENEVFVQSFPEECSGNNAPSSYYIISTNRDEDHEMYQGAEMDIQRLQRTSNPSYSQDPCLVSAETSFGEENMLDNLSRHVAMQQQYICNAMNIVPISLDNSARCYAENESYTVPCQEYSIEEPQALNDSLNGSLINSGFAVPQQTINSFNQPIIHLHSTPESNPVRNKSKGGMQGENMETPENHGVLTSQGRYVYTPHPRTGQLLYVRTADDGSPQLYHPLPTVPATPIQPSQPDTSQFSTPKTSSSNALNSSGEEGQDSSSGDPPTDKSTTTDVSSTSEGSTSLLSSSADKNKFYDISLFSSCVGEDGREQHNLKERRRRARIKDACDVLRKLVPGMSDKTDKATVFEFAARYVHFLKGFVGNQHDKDFLLKYSPY